MARAAERGLETVARAVGRRDTLLELEAAARPIPHDRRGAHAWQRGDPLRQLEEIPVAIEVAVTIGPWK